MYIFMVFSILFNTDFQIELAKKYTLNADYEVSDKILNTINVFPLIYNDYHYYRAINYFKLNNKLKAQYHLFQIARSFEPIENRRQQVIIQLMQQDILNWKKEDLGDIARDMQVSKDKLEIYKPNMQVQKDIIVKLDKLIKEQEDAKLKKLQMASSNPSNPITPLPESQASIERGKGIVLEKQLQNYEKNWGTLPEKERKQIIVQITNQLPSKYRADIEAYFKALSKYEQK